MLCSPQRPTEKGNPKEFPFRYPAQLKRGEALNEYWDVDVALMIYQKNILPFWIEMAQTSNFQPYATNHEDDASPQTGNSVAIFPIAIKKSEQDYQESGRHGDHRDHKQLKAIKHGDLQSALIGRND